MPRTVKHAPKSPAPPNEDPLAWSSDDEPALKRGTKGALGVKVPTVPGRSMHDITHTSVFQMKAVDDLPWTKAYIVEKDPVTKKLSRTHFRWARDHARDELFIPEVHAGALPQTRGATKHWINNHDAFKQSLHALILQKIVNVPDVVKQDEYSQAESYLKVLASIQRHIVTEREHHKLLLKEAREEGEKLPWHELRERVAARPAADSKLEGLHRMVVAVVDHLTPDAPPEVPEVEGPTSGQVTHFLFTCKRAVMLAAIKNIRKHYAKASGSSVDTARHDILEMEKKAQGCEKNLTTLFEHLKTFPPKQRGERAQPKAQPKAQPRPRARRPRSSRV